MPDEKEVKVQFFGICTHMEPQPHATVPAHWGHRVVLVNASDPKSNPDPRIQALNAHVARLQIKSADILGGAPATPWFPIVFNDGETIEWGLHGVVLGIGGALRLEAGSRMGDCIPHLRDCCIKLPSAGPATHEEDRGKTACFFDFPVAEFAGKLHGQGASMGVLTLHAAHPTVEVRDFGLNGASLAFPIRAGAEVSVSNIPLDSHADKEEDFLLHFLAAEQMPVGPTIPPKGFTCAEPLRTYNLPRNLGDITGPGCSNSNYL
jgi:hypothetical protein